jgi:DNA-directed RNA polymerase specialized sigma subunit
LLRAPRRVRDLEKRWVAAERELWTLLGREPRESDIAQYVNATVAEQREVNEYRASGHVVPFDLLQAADQRAGAQSFDAVIDKIALEGMLATLAPLERKIVRAIHIDGMRVVDLAKRLGYSRRHLTRLHRSAMARLRQAGH